MTPATTEIKLSMVETANAKKPIEVATDDIEVADNPDDEHVPASALEEGAPPPKYKPIRNTHGIHLRTVRAVRMEIARCYRMWWANRMSDADLNTAKKTLELLLKAKQIEILSEAVRENSEEAREFFAGLRITFAGKELKPSSEEKKR